MGKCRHCGGVVPFPGTYDTRSLGHKTWIHCCQSIAEQYSRLSKLDLPSWVDRSNLTQVIVK